DRSGRGPSVNSLLRPWRVVEPVPAPPALAQAGDECFAGFLSWILKAFAIGKLSRPTTAPSGRHRRRPAACRRGRTPGTVPAPRAPPGGPADERCPRPRAAPPD